MSYAVRYRTERLSANRRMVVANSALARERHVIHLVVETDVTTPRALMAEYRASTGETLSFTAYVATCAARTLAEFPEMNAFRRGRRVVVLEDVAVTVAIERVRDGGSVPEPVGIQAAATKSYREIHDELRAAQGRSEINASTAADAFMHVLPGFALRALTRLAYREPAVWQRLGVIGITSVGMFGPNDPMWLVPLTSSTISVGVGSICKRAVIVDGTAVEREHVCLTLSFDHDLIDGAPAARFAKRLSERLSDGHELRELIGGE